MKEDYLVPLVLVLGLLTLGILIWSFPTYQQWSIEEPGPRERSPEHKAIVLPSGVIIPVD